MGKNFKKVVFSILICVSFLPLKVEAALLGWDLVDSGKHLD